MTRLGLPENEAVRANEARDSLLHSLSDMGINAAFKQAKIYYGDLSPG
jgi:hypothetical protein